MPTIRPDIISQYIEDLLNRESPDQAPDPRTRAIENYMDEQGKLSRMMSMQPWVYGMIKEGKNQYPQSESGPSDDDDPGDDTPGLTEEEMLMEGLNRGKR